MADDINEGDEYEILPHKEITELREELKKLKLAEGSPTKKMTVSIVELNAKMDKLIEIFETATRDLREEAGGLSVGEQIKPLAERLNKALEQNSEIAEGVVALADMIKDLRDDLETKGVIVREEKIVTETAEPAIQPIVTEVERTVPIPIQQSFGTMPRPMTAAQGAFGQPQLPPMQRPGMPLPPPPLPPRKKPGFL